MILLSVSERGEPLYADSAYTGDKQEAIISNKKLVNEVCEKGYKNNPLTDKQKEGNREKSRIRARVEHIFGFMEGAMQGMYLYAIGEKRIGGIVGLMSLTYNIFRKIQLQQCLIEQCD